MPENELQLRANAADATWSVSWRGAPLVTAARYGVVHQEAKPIQADHNYLKFRMYQEGGDWHAYIGCLQFGGDESGKGAEYVDSFRQQTPPERYVSATNVMWRTNVEDGLICPKARKEWAEIVYKTSQKKVWWVVQAVGREEAVEVHGSPDGKTWSLLTRVSETGGITPAHRDADKRPLGSLARSLLAGPGTQATAPFQDALRRGTKTVLTHVLKEAGLEVELALFHYDELPLLGIEAEARNRGQEDYPLREILLGEARGENGGALSLGVPPERCSMLGNGLWMGGSAMTRFDERREARAYWSTAIGDRESLSALVLGVGEAANCEARFDVRRNDGAFDLAIRAGCASDPAGRPLALAPGRNFRTCRYLLLACDNIHDGLERYAECVRRFGRVPGLQPAYQGLFTGYSSDPNLETVVRLDERRVNVLLDILGRALGAYGPQTVKIEFEPCGSPNLWNPQAYRMADYFPQGPVALTREIRRRGFRPALQSRTFAYVAGGEPDEAEKVRAIYAKVTQSSPSFPSSAWERRSRAQSGLGSQAELGNQGEGWGFEYLMLDFNSSDARNLDPHRTFFEVIRDRFRTIREAVGPSVFIEACMCCAGPVIGSADGYRPAGDYRGGNEDSLLPDFANRYYYHGAVFQLDSEFYDVAQRPFVWQKRTVSTPIEGNRTWCSLCAIAGLSFLVGGDIEHTTAERWDVVRRVLPVYGRRGRPLDLLETNLPRLWSLEAEYGGRSWKVIGLFNWSYDQEAELTVDFARCGLDPKATFLLFDFWRREFLGKGTARQTVRLRPRQCQVLHVLPDADRPTLVGTDRHVTGAFAAESVAWDAESAALHGSSAGPRGSTTHLYVYLPPAWRRPPLAARGCEAEVIGADCLRLGVTFPEGGRLDWSVSLDKTAGVR